MQSVCTAKGRWNPALTFDEIFLHGSRHHAASHAHTHTLWVEVKLSRYRLDKSLLLLWRLGRPRLGPTSSNGPRGRRRPIDTSLERDCPPIGGVLRLDGLSTDRPADRWTDRSVQHPKVRLAPVGRSVGLSARRLANRVPGRRKSGGWERPVDATVQARRGGGR
ncbi:unnamed protein product [Protopolystoma xenopodis]|uniref:Uncharacterized protein n=1 Tax=Protopolystoma xenopodis TaxID=117903 RepID=A0A3S5BHT5_9PLAT|nr:unnamed protein product [Protopolystoma xenopodis]